MPDLTITVTDAQLKVVRQLDPVKTAKQVVQAHIDTWLAPYLVELDEAERKALITAYKAASTPVRDQVKGLLGVG